MFDSLSIGDASVDVFFKIHEAEVNCELNKEHCKLVINYGDKLICDQLDFTIGGNACNNAVGLSRLGKNVTFYNISGEDENRQKIMAGLKNEGIDTSSMVALEGRRANFAGVLNFQGEKTQFIFHDKHEYEVSDKLPITPYLYLSSVGATYQQFFFNLANFCQQHQVKLSFNPASHQLREPIANFESIMKVADMLFMNKEEAATILMMSDELRVKNKGDDLKIIVKEMLTKLKAYGCRYAVVTDGPAGSYAYDGQKYYYIDIWEDFPVVERTGCGDAYASAFMVAVINGSDVKEAMRWGTFNGGSVVTQVGPQAALLHLEEMRKYLDDHPEFVAVEI